MRPTFIDQFKLQRKDALFFLIYAAIFFATWYFMHSADRFLSLTPKALGKYFPVKCILILHITAGGGSLVLGPFQFWYTLLRNYPKTHRGIGYAYLLAVLASSSCAVILAHTTAYENGWPYAFSLQVWVVVWIVSSYIGFAKAKARKFREHKEWMTRSYLTALAFVLSALVYKIPAIQQLGSFEVVTPSLYWAAWSIPMLLYQVYLSSKLSSTK